MQKAETFQQNRRLFIEKLALEQMRGVRGDDGSRISRFNWPRKNNGTQYDRTVVLQVFEDGSWGAYLDNPHISVEDTISDFRRMVKA